MSNGDTTLEEEEFQGRLNIGLWKKILRFAIPYKWRLVAVVVIGITVAAIDTAITLITGLTIDAIKQKGPDANVWGYLAIYASMLFVFTFLIYGFIRIVGYIETSISHDIRHATFRHLQSLEFGYFDKKAVGWLMARLTSDCSRMSRVMGWGVLDTVWGTTVLLMVGATMFVLNWRLALVVLTVVPLLYFVSRYFEVRILRTSRASRKANSIVTGAFNENVQGVRTTRSLSREQENLDEFGVLANRLYGHSVSNMLWSAGFAPVVASLCSLGIGLALWRGGVEVLSGHLTIGMLVTFINYAMWINHPIEELATTYTNVQNAQASGERVMSVLATKPAISDNDKVRSAIAKQAKSPIEGMAIDGMPASIDRVEFDNVSFHYEADKPVLKNFSLDVEAPATIALVGPTGGGKSTIVSLLCRFYEPISGEIRIDGVDYRQRSLHWLQSSLGMVLQQPHMFSGSVRENIRYGRLDATDAEVEEAAQLVFADEFIRQLKDGYDSEVGEGGIQLSTGQKQLLALARAILANPRIFVLDEATSSVDTETENLLQQAVDRVLHGRISFVIAHRLSTIRQADRILVIESGEISEQGTHAKLIRAGGHYADLYTSQFTHDAEDAVLAAE